METMGCGLSEGGASPGLNSRVGLRPSITSATSWMRAKVIAARGRIAITPTLHMPQVPGDVRTALAGLVTSKLVTLAEVLDRRDPLRHSQAHRLAHPSSPLSAAPSSEQSGRMRRSTAQRLRHCAGASRRAQPHSP